MADAHIWKGLWRQVKAQNKVSDLFVEGVFKVKNSVIF